MRYFPLFLDLRDRPVLVVGGGEEALNKVRLLLKTEARIRLIAPEIHAELAGYEAKGLLSVDRTADPLSVDLQGYALVVGTAGDPVDGALSQRAQALGIPVNVVDRTELCSFITPSIVDRGTVTVAIGTEGAAPVLARRLRARIEALLPARLGALADLIGSRRPRLARSAPDAVQRRRFWEAIVDGPVGATALAGDDAGAAEALDSALQALETHGAPETEGAVFLVGAGPGDPELLTLKALRVLQDADIIFHDDLVSSDVLNLARRDAERVSVGKRAGQRCMKQTHINERLAEAAGRGLRVVRLKGGDPFVFARGGEEMAYLQERGIRVVVVPGITAALGCASDIELPLTHRGEAARLTLLTAHRAAEAAAIDWSGLSDADTTLAIYMGKATAPVVSRGLIAAGRDPATPVAVIANGTRADSVTMIGRLDALPALVARAGDGPALLLVGEVVRRSRPWREEVGRSEMLAG